MKPTPDMPLSDALRFVRDAVQAEFVALRAARDTVIRTAPANGPIQPALANIDERVFQLHGALRVLEQLVTTTLEQRARAGEAGRLDGLGLCNGCDRPYGVDVVDYKNGLYHPACVPRDLKHDDSEPLCCVCGDDLGGVDWTALACGGRAHPTCIASKDKPPTHPELWADDLAAKTCRQTLRGVIVLRLGLTGSKADDLEDVLASEEARQAFAFLLPAPSLADDDDIPF
jgi:hypothetical protein